MKPFLDEDFLLHSDVARELYHDHAAKQPIFDYHCHLPPQQIAANTSFPNLYSIWLAGDHYKWRAMRTNGVGEEYCTGSASDKEKFLAFARTVPATLRNPLYHWTHLELQRYFGIHELLNEDTAEKIWDAANEQLASPELSVHGILEKNRVAVVCTTDDPIDSLDDHQQIRAAANLTTRVYPTFRPDKAMAVGNASTWNAWTDKLAAVSDLEIGDLNDFKAALSKRHDFFHALGGRLSDHGLEACPEMGCTDEAAASIFAKVRNGEDATASETMAFGGYLMVFFGELDAAKGWTKQLHLGAMRNNNTRLFKALGPDTGFDSIGDYSQGRTLSRYLDRLDQNDRLPKIVFYNLNPSDNYLFATMAGNFQDGSIAGKIQFGSGWWFLDQKEGMIWQMNALSNLGLLSRFVGMLTDSRSFLSFPRHEYFRRILCNLIGEDVVRGELPHDMKLLGGVVEDICYRNAENFFGVEPGQFS